MKASSSIPARPVPWNRVRIEDRFWTPRQRANREVTLPHEYRMCRETGRIDAFRLDWKPDRPNPPHIFWDSDVAKWIEAAAYSLGTHPDPELARQAEETVAQIVAAQQADGYLNVHFTVVEPEKRWTNLRDWHELYCAGHMIEAGVALFQATGQRALLDAMGRYADHIGTVFGTAAGQKRGYPGHEEIELALVKLYGATGQSRYLDLACYFIDERGRQPHYYDAEARARGEDPAAFWAKTYAYCQAHKPVREQTEVVGHAVRAFYLYSGMADVAALTADEGLRTACRALWSDLTTRKMYVTGGIGPSAHNEGFTAKYDLPNRTAYAETCAAIALGFFAHRMLHLEADARYADVLERILYNGSLSGVSLDGSRFFYVNPLSSDGAHHRQEWFGCACCPPNIARLLASLGGYAYSSGAASAWVHLYVGGTAELALGGQVVRLTQSTDYPWEGAVGLEVQTPEPLAFDLFLRIPGWCGAWSLRVNGRRLAVPVRKGYARVRRRWSRGDMVELDLAMPVERMAANPAVGEDLGKVALQRGPLVYGVEECDTPAVRSLVLPRRAKIRPRWDGHTLGGVTVLEGEAAAVAPAGWQGKLYRRAAEQVVRPARLRAVPYFAWDNRKPGAMAVWLPECV